LQKRPGRRKQGNPPPRRSSSPLPCESGVCDGFSIRTNCHAVFRPIAPGKTVLVIGEAAHFAQYDWRCSVKALKLRTDCATRFSYRRPVPDTSNDALRALVTEAGARYVDFNDLICPGGVCSPYDGKTPLYFDAAHISLPGSWHLGRKAGASRAYANLFAEEKAAALVTGGALTGPAPGATGAIR
jgi:hypothetical protein